MIIILFYTLNQFLNHLKFIHKLFWSTLPLQKSIFERFTKRLRRMRNYFLYSKKKLFIFKVLQTTFSSFQSFSEAA